MDDLRGHTGIEMGRLISAFQELDTTSSGCKLIAHHERFMVVSINERFIVNANRFAVFYRAR